MKRNVTLVLLAALALNRAAWGAEPEVKQGCEAFKWDLSTELATMRQAAVVVDASRGATTSKIEVGKHYTVRLSAQGEVRFAAPPEKSKPAEGSHAGTLTFRVSRAGVYRVSITSSHWADVVDGEKLIKARAHEGHGGCDALHKIVEFALEPGRDLTLQLSGAAASEIGVAITAVASSG